MPRMAAAALASMLVGHATVGKAAEAIKPERAYDPDPLPGDFALPMPCDLKMVFRLVCVPAAGDFSDESLLLGQPSSGEPQGFYDQQRVGHISGAFTYDSLPPAWRKQVDAIAARPDQRGRCPKPQDTKSAKGPSPYYYFIGKYTVSVRQYAAVTDAQCPAPTLAAEDNLPKTHIGWFDAVAFAERYTEWLYREQRSTLPATEDSDDVFVRLPTESEWEYAARGGHMVNPDDLEQEPVFPLKGRPLTDYAWFSPEGSTPKQSLSAIGSLAPNPLGLYDIVGNAAQIVLDPFHLSVGRNHGAVGGFITKGGSFRSREAAVNPGSRTENRYFTDGKPHAVPDAGLRVVLSSLVVTADRIGALRDEWSAREGTGEPLPEFDPKRDPVGQIQRLEANTDDPRMKTALNGITATLKENAAATLEQQREAAKGLIRAAAFTAEACLNYDIRLSFVTRDEADMREKLARSKDAKKIAEAKIELEKVDRAITILRAAADQALMYYISLVARSRNYPSDVLQSQFQSVLDEASNQGVFGPVVAKRVSAFQRHVSLYEKSGGKLDREQIRKEVLGL